MSIKELSLKSGPSIETILAEYCENVETTPTEECKRFFRERNEGFSVGLVRQCIFAGIYYAITHPEDVEVTE